MFGGQDDNAAAQGGGAPQDDTLNGVSALVDGSMPPADDQDNGSGDAPMSAPSESQQPDEEVAGPTPDMSDDLLELKQQALQQLTPLVGHLDQSPEEKFRTTMMLIQASDNQSLLKEAYEAAQAIEDEKTRAQALLDVVNEINYFTQGKQQD